MPLSFKAMAQDPGEVISKVAWVQNQQQELPASNQQRSTPAMSRARCHPHRDAPGNWDMLNSVFLVTQASTFTTCLFLKKHYRALGTSLANWSHIISLGGTWEGVYSSPLKLLLWPQGAALVADDVSTCSQHTDMGQLLWSPKRSPGRKQQGVMSSRWLPAGAELFVLSRTFLPAHKNTLRWRKGRARNQILMFIAEKISSLQLGHKFPCECKGDVGAHFFQIPMSFSVGVKPNWSLTCST